MGWRRSWIVYLCVWLSMWVVGCGLHFAADGEQIAGFDSEQFLVYYQNIGDIFKIWPRHPLIAPLTAPVYVLGWCLAQAFGTNVAAVGTLAVFAAIGTFCVYMIRRISGTWMAVALWLMFPYAWIVSALAESFVISTALLLVALAFVKERNAGALRWGLLTAVTGGVTVTNAIKVLLAALAGGVRVNWRKMLLLLAAAAGLVLVAFVLKWRHHGMDVVAGFRSTADESIRWFNGNGLFALRAVWERFFLEPIWPHGKIIGVSVVPVGYGSWLPHVWGMVVYGAAVVRGIQRRHEPLVRAMAAMFAFDLAFHVVFGWGLDEAQLYSPHWLFVVPLMVFTGDERKCGESKHAPIQTSIEP